MDALARDYLLVALGIGELEEGVVDAYYGPPELRQQAADANQSAAAMANQAAALRDHLNDATDDEQRRRWLDRQLIGLETIANRLAGVELPYVEEVTRCFDATPEATPPEEYARVRSELEELLPGTGDVHERLAQRDARMVIPPDRLGDIADWVFAELRAAAAQRWPLPQGESCTFSMVRDQPWAAYNWYDGNLASRIEINTDLPMRADQLPGVVAHETFPGHHLEHVWHEQRLYRERGYAEVSVQLINTPEAYMSEGLGETGAWLLNDDARWQALLLEICDRAGIPLSHADAQREWRIAAAKHRLRGVSGDAALQLFVAKRSREDVLRFLEQDALATPERAAKSLEFIEHPLWRTYVFCYAGGERLLTKWVNGAADESARDERFFRLLTEQLTPSGIAAEITY